MATRISMVGDSLTAGTLPYQAAQFSEVGWGHSAIDSFKTRGIRTKAKADPHTGLTAVDAIRETSGDSDLWVVALGTNDAGIHPRDRYPELIRQMNDRIGRDHYVMWVNIYLPTNLPRQKSWNAALEAVAEERPDEMFVYDWAALAAKNASWMADDQLHNTGTGYSHRATAIAQATRTLVPSVPIVRDPRRARPTWPSRPDSPSLS